MPEPNTPKGWVAFCNDDPGLIQYVDDREEHDHRVNEATGGNISFTYVPIANALVAHDLLDALELFLGAVSHETGEVIDVPRLMQAIEEGHKAASKARGLRP